MIDDIVIFTHHYPWLCGPTAETYLEEEVRLLAKRARRVWVLAISCWSTGTLELRAGLPANLTAFQIVESDWDQPSSWISRKIGQLGALFTPEFLSDRHLIANRARLVEFCRFMGKSKSLARLAWEKISAASPEFAKGSGKSLLVYSFWFDHPARAAVLFSRMARSHGRKHVVAISRAHGYDCYAYRNDLDYLPCQRWSALHLDRVLVCSKDGSSYLERRTGLGGRRSDDLPYFETGYLGTADCGLGPVPDTGGRFHIVTCSRLVPLKRLDRVARSLALCPSRNRMLWTCIGDGEESERLGKLVRELGLSTSVEFTGSLTREQVLEYYREHPVDLFLNASDTEGVPLSIMEALSFGIPCVATRVGGNSEIVIDGVNGYLIDKDFDDAGLAAVIERSASGTMSRMRASARRSWEERFSVRTNAGALIDDLMHRMN